jgi:hypothetical protein
MKSNLRDSIRPLKKHLVRIKPLFIALGMIVGGGLFSAQAQQDSAKLYQKEEQLFIAMNLPDMFTKVVNDAVEQQLTATPALVDYRADVKSFFDKYISWPAVKADVAKLYLQYFTSDEIDTLIKFYKTSAGKKMTANSTRITQEITAMVQSKIQPHVSEWNQFVSEKVNGKPPGDAGSGNN